MSETHSSRQKLISTILLVLTAVIWGFAFVAQVFGSDVPPILFTCVRFLLGGCLLIPVSVLFEHGEEAKSRRKTTFGASLVAGTVLFIASALQQFGINYTQSSGKSGFITGLYTVMTPIFALLLFRRKTPLTVWIGAVLATGGLYFLCYVPGEGFTFGVGELFLFTGAFFWAGHVLVVDHFGQRVNSLHFSWQQFIVCGLWSLLLTFIFEEPTWGAIWGARWALLYLAVFSVGIAYTFQILGQKHVGPTVAAIIFSLESVFSAIGGALFGIDSFYLTGYLGCAMIFISIVISQWQPANRKRALKSDKKTE